MKFGRSSLTEELKEKMKWRIEIAVLRLQATDWDEVGQRWERRIRMCCKESVGAMQGRTRPQ